MSNLVAKLLGWVLLLAGIGGFFVPHAGGAQLSNAQNLLHILTGGVSLWCGAGTVRAARTACALFGAGYAVLGVAGLAYGTPGDGVLRVIPGTLELGTMDHMVHVALSAVYVVAALATRTTLAATPAPRA